MEFSSYPNIKKISLLDLKKKSIDNIIDEMERLLFKFSNDKSKHSLKSFLKVYLLVTKKVNDLKSKNFFDKPQDLEVLDIHFANLYFKPVYRFLTKRMRSTPWSNYLKYSQRNIDPFILMLIGINSHINSDLLQSLVDLDYLNEKDFFKVNDILLEIIPEIMSYLAFEEHDIWGIGGLIFSDFAKYEFSKTIVSWRTKVWENSIKIKERNLQDTYLADVRNQTEMISEAIIDIFNSINHMKNIPQKFKELNSLYIDI